MKSNELKWRAATAAFGMLIGGAVHADFAPTYTPKWSGDAHDRLLNDAFADQREDCLHSMQRGSAWVDSLMNQGPSKSYMHSMRASGQSIEAARSMMADFVQSHYEVAVNLYHQSTREIRGTPTNPWEQVTHDGRLITNMQNYLESCRERGIALHPVMDSTSPAHGNLEEWSLKIWTLDGLVDFLSHGDLAHSIEDLDTLLHSPVILRATTGLMIAVDKIYLELGERSFRLE